MRHARNLKNPLWPRLAASERLSGLPCVPETSKIGVAILDRRLKFCAVNRSLAQSNGIPIEAHIGSTLFGVIGRIAESIAPQCEAVFTSGNAVAGFEISAQLPARSEVGHWVEDFFPIVNSKNRITHVCALVVDVTEQKTLPLIFDGFRGAMLRNIDLLRQETLALSEQLLTNNRMSPAIRRNLVAIRQAVDESRHLLMATTAELRRTQAKCSPMPPPYHGTLSARQIQVVRLLADGYSNKQIGAILEISPKTVETYRSRIMLKLEIDSFAALIRFALANGLA